MCPVARPLASSSEGDKAAPGAGFAEIRTPKLSSFQDSVPRISSTRLALIASLLTPTERAVLGAVARTRLCSGAQLERLYWHEGNPASRARQARRVLGQLAEWRILDRLPRQVGGPAHAGLCTASARLACGSLPARVAGVWLAWMLPVTATSPTPSPRPSYWCACTKLTAAAPWS